MLQFAPANVLRRPKPWVLSGNKTAVSLTEDAVLLQRAATDQGVEITFGKTHPHPHNPHTEYPIKLYQYT